MHVGYSLAPQNPGNRLSDAEVFRRDLRLVDLAVELGFESLWVVEHHFSEYLISPDPLQLLTWFGARHPRVGLGAGVVVLPWHHPIRCAEQIALLDNLSGGRLILGVGRGISRHEYEGFGLELESGRERFLAHARTVFEALESGWIEADDEFARIPRRELRPRPEHSLRGRIYAGAMSPEAMPLMARLGIGLLIIPQKPWPVVRQDLDAYRATWREAQGPDLLPPAPLSGGLVFIDRDPARARERAERYIGGYYHSVMAHYGFHSHAHAGVRGYEFYEGVSRHIDKRGTDGAARDYVDLMPWGTPDQVLAKLERLHELLGMAAFNPSFSFGGIPVEEAEASLRLFAREVLPVLKTWKSEPLALPGSKGVADE
jgi:alkanesulfonate monooxygenase SsuD/methylene tetrahydromethanopterin reductase-like flavin-dependent oxidoreductase (luciferase family)